MNLSAALFVKEICHWIVNGFSKRRWLVSNSRGARSCVQCMQNASQSMLHYQQLRGMCNELTHSTKHSIRTQSISTPPYVYHIDIRSDTKIISCNKLRRNCLRRNIWKPLLWHVDSYCSNDALRKICYGTWRKSSLWVLRYLRRRPSVQQMARSARLNSTWHTAGRPPFIMPSSD